jgi:hypothetical protein
MKILYIKSIAVDIRGRVASFKNVPSFLKEILPNHATFLLTDTTF